jgi:hypothetical protein
MTTQTTAQGVPFSLVVQASGVLAGYKLHTYVAGSTTPQATYNTGTTDGGVANSNPITLDTNGAATIRYLANTGYKLVLNDPTDVTTVASIDNFYAYEPQSFFGGTDTGGGANTYVVTPGGFATLTAGIMVWFEPANTNTGASTLNVNGTGAKNVTNPDGNAIVAGQLVVNQPSLFFYDGSNWILINQAFRSGTFTGTFTGFTGSVTGTVYYTRTGSSVTMTLPAVTGTSNTTAMTMTGIPSIIQPNSTAGALTPLAQLEDNTAVVTTGVLVSVTAGTATFYNAHSASGFTGSGTKGTGATALTFTYNVA